MELVAGQVTNRRNQLQDPPSPSRLIYLSFSTCPYQTTTNSTVSHERSHSNAKHAHDKEPKAESVASGTSRKSKFSERSLLRKCSVFDKIELRQEKDCQIRLIKQKKEQIEVLQLSQTILPQAGRSQAQAEPSRKIQKASDFAIGIFFEQSMMLRLHCILNTASCVIDYFNFMFRPITNLCQRLLQFGRAVGPLAIRPVLVSAPHIIKPLFMTTGCYLQMLYWSPFRAQQISKEDTKFLMKEQPKPVSLMARVAEIFMTMVRFFHLLLIFSPVIVTLPLRMFDSTKDWWIDLFVESVARAGVVWIKAFQYLSHRRDMIGEDVAKKFVKLREDAPQHSYKVTCDSFKRQFGKEISDIFDEFDSVPIASGSVSQVYQAVYKGQKVAVKVRHPGVEVYIQRDINLLFFISKCLSVFSPRCEIPVGEESLKKTLTDQIDFNIEARNLKLFGEMFKYNEKVKFPKPIEESTTPGVLVETFVEGEPITNYEGHRHRLNNVIARIGAMTFFEMLMKNNFIHADCHGGNIMVKIKEHSNTLKEEVTDFFRGVYKAIEKKLMLWSFSSKLFKDLYLESRREDDQAFLLERELHQKVEVTLIDVGMVIELDETDRRNFVSFIQSFIMQEPDQCAQMIYSLSLYKGHKIINESLDKYKSYYQDLKDLFKEIKNKPLKSIDGTKLFKNMLDLIRESKMKLDGQFATLLTNMLVLQAIAKDLNPDINILKCAIPYFKSA